MTEADRFRHDATEIEALAASEASLLHRLRMLRVAQSYRRTANTLDAEERRLQPQVLTGGTRKGGARI
jgi:hypothetical protein